MGVDRAGACFMIGDFNEITGNHEKRGGRRRAESTFILFRTMLANCGMLDFPYKGNCLSWAGKIRRGRVQCRLDRAVGNEDWHHLFSHTDVEYLKLWGLDNRFPTANRRKLERGIPFEPFGFPFQIVDCRKAISRWKKSNPSNSEKKIEELKNKIDEAQGLDSVSAEEELQLKWQLCAAFRDEETYWRQKSRATWMREGDRNTK
ncbi:PREDICTED: uncharacterized protein LOC104759393 [Camelina sativa]|uniref:Uncharacterized protein LOC104759393 n=1 Tax=Camelina sativa TaxID=90675 RepID=A0ABM0X4Q6_CAMSA|nr:PREDICTED: uncharacterized protein LOC104759393 [Camelina sativa]